MTPLRVAMIVFLAASIFAQPLDVSPSAAQLREWIDDKCVSSGKRVGIDYPGALERAIRREPAGLAELFRYTVSGDLDGKQAKRTPPSFSVCCSDGATDDSLMCYVRRSSVSARP
jgi:hypothetical protein